MILNNDTLYRKNLKGKIQIKLAEKKLQREQIKFLKPPRYDDVFFEGVKWLDSLAGDPVKEQDGEMDPALPE
jgi:hypothetical protein